MTPKLVEHDQQNLLAELRAKARGKSHEEAVKERMPYLVGTECYCDLAQVREAYELYFGLHDGVTHTDYISLRTAAIEKDMKGAQEFVCSKIKTIEKDMKGAQEFVCSNLQ
jgi:hypothetical protein